MVSQSAVRSGQGCVCVGGNVHILPLPEETAASDTFPRSSDGARSPQTSEEDQNTYFED